MFKMVEKLVPVQYVVFPDGFEVRLKTLADVLNSLADTDGFLTRLAIHSESLGSKLVELGVAEETGRGSYCEGKNFDTVVKELEKQFPDTTWR